MASTSTFGTRTGNHIIILMDGQDVGLIQNLRGSDDYGVEPVSGIGSINIQEYVPTVARYQVTCGMVALRRFEFGNNSFIPQNGAAALKGLIFDIVIMDAFDTTNDASAPYSGPYGTTGKNPDPNPAGSGIDRGGPDQLNPLIPQVSTSQSSWNKDNPNAGPLKQYIGCTYASGDFSIEAHRMIIRNATFMALDVLGPF